MRKVLRNIDYKSLMHPDDKKTINWLNGLRVPYLSNFEFISEIARHPLDHSIKDWYEIFKIGVREGTEYYTFQDFLSITTSKFKEAYNEVECQGEGVDITRNSLSSMYGQLIYACDILGINDVPAYSTDWEYGPYHFSNGEKHRRIVMMSGSVDLFTYDEMLFVLGHELGHQACGHKPYHMLVETFYMPFVNDGAFKAWSSIIKMPLFEWYRKSDYTADRVGLLCCQDIDVALSTMIKKAGLPKKLYGKINIPAFKEQAKEFQTKYTGKVNTIIKELSIRSAEYPWLVDRAGKLLEWYYSGEYERILKKNQICLPN